MITCKSKYIRREGVPGHWRYYYSGQEPKGWNVHTDVPSAVRNVLDNLEAPIKEEVFVKKFTEDHFNKLAYLNEDKLNPKFKISPAKAFKFMQRIPQIIKQINELDQKELSDYKAVKKLFDKQPYEVRKTHYKMIDLYKTSPRVKNLLKLEFEV